MKNTVGILLVVGIITLNSCNPFKQTDQTTPVTQTPPTTETVTVEQTQPKKRAHYNTSEKRINDILHTKLKVNFDWINQQMHGEAYLTIKPYFYPTDSLTLDAKAMDIHQVLLGDENSSEKLKYTYDGWYLRIQLPKEYNRTENYQIYIKYTANPEKVTQEGSSAISSAKGLYFINHDGSDPNKHQEIWTQGETEASSVWFPTIDSPNEKTTEEIYITVQDKFTTLSNGLMVESKENGNGTRTDHWKMDLPHAPYLFMMAIGEFAVVKDSWKRADGSEMEVNYYVEKKFEPHAQAIFGKTPEMIDYFSKRLGVEYPWPKYSQIVVRDYVSGAMENTTATIHGEFLYQTKRELIDGGNESIIAHELFHHWFGDYATCESWANLPLNESFANYSQFLWDEHEYGRMEADMNAYGEMEGYFLSASQGGHVDMIRYDYKNKEDMFDGHSYNKGGRILNMLRAYVGDEAFFESLKNYLNKKKFQPAEIHELRLSFEEVTGEDLNWFFNQWFLASGHPVVKIEQEYDETAKEIKLHIVQKQNLDEWPLYKLPVMIDIYEGGKPRREMIWIEQEDSTYTLQANQKPDLVNVDALKVMLWKKADKKDISQWVYQLNHAGLWLDKKEAIDKLASKSDDASVDAMINALRHPFWNVKTMAIDKIRKAVDKKPEEVKTELKRLALEDESPKVRSKAIKALSKYFNEDASLIGVYEKAAEDSSYNVMGAGIKAIAKADPSKGMELAKKYENAESSTVNNIVASIYAENGTAAEHDFFLNTVKELNGFNKIGFLQNYNKYLLRQSYDEIEKGVEVFTDVIHTESIWYIKLSGYNLLSGLQTFYNKKGMEISAKLDDNTQETADLQRELNYVKAKEAEIKSLLDELRAKETDENIKKYFR